jgi:hypothetical protein
MFRVSVSVALVLSLMSIGACKNKNDTTVSTVRVEEIDGSFTKIFVMGVGRNDSRRRLYEDSLVAALRAEGVEAQPSYEVFPQTEKLEREQVLKKVTEGGFDAVSLAHLIWVSKEQEFVPSHHRTERVSSAPGGNADAYMRANTASLYIDTYDSSYDAHHEPGYYKTNEIYSVETMVFRVESGGDKVWWALSETLNPESVEGLINSVVAGVVRWMKEDGIIE